MIFAGHDPEAREKFENHAMARVSRHLHCDCDHTTKTRVVTSLDDAQATKMVNETKNYQGLPALRYTIENIEQRYKGSRKI